MHFHELDTPQLCVDVDVLDANIAQLQVACDELQIGDGQWVGIEHLGVGIDCAG